MIQLIELGLSSHKIAKQLNCSQTTISYWLKKYDLKTNRDKSKYKSGSSYKIIDGCEYKLCPRCSEEKKISEFILRKRGGHYCYCKPCLSNQAIERHSKLKLQCLEYKGGKCVCCGYDKCVRALEFHHVDPNEKDFEISKRTKRKFEEIKKELDKCELVCCNCHREIHSGLRELPIFSS